MSVYYEKRRKHWVYKFWMDNVVYQKGGFSTRSAASKAEREKRNELENPPEPLPTPTISFHEIATQYLTHCTATFQPNTVRYKKQYLKAFINDVLEKDTEFAAEDVSTKTFEDYLDKIAADPEQGRKLSNRHLKDLSAMYNWAVRTRRLKDNPLRHIEPKGEDAFVKYVPPPEDVTAVLLAADQEEMDLVLTVYGTAGRISEILRLKWEDVNMTGGSITLWTRKRKGGGLQPDTLHMTKKVEEVMARRWKNRNKQSPYVFCRCDGSQYTKDHNFVRKLMSRLCEKAKVKPFGFHAIRHRVASLLMDSGKATLREIQQFLRHHRPTTTDNYLKSISPGSGAMASVLNAFEEEQVSNNQKEENTEASEAGDRS